MNNHEMKRHETQHPEQVQLAPSLRRPILSQCPPQTCKIERAVHGSSDGLWEWNIKTSTVWYAPGYAELLGYEDGELPPELDGWKATVHPIDAEDFWRAIEQHLATEEEFDRPCRLQTKNGDYCWFRIRGFVFRDAEGQPEIMAGSIRDVDELIRTQEALREKEAQLLQQQKMEAVGSLAGGMSHEFNNLLQAIRGYTCFARDALEKDTEPYRDLNQVLVATDRAAELTRQLLDYSRTNSVEPCICSANEIVDELTLLLRPLISETIEMILQLDPQGPQLYADPKFLQQVLMNLCINARDAMPDGGKLCIRTERIDVSRLESQGHAELKPGQYVRFLVTDTGTGIPPEVQDRIFEPFFTTKEVGTGTGLGLAMAFGVVQQNGGFINCYSEIGFGTTFRIYLPTSGENSMNQQCEQEQNNNQSAVLEGQGKTILLAEDDHLVSEVGRRMLSRAGYTVISAEDGEEALQLIIANVDQIDLLLLDVCMPKMTGRAVLEHVRRMELSVPVCFCTGYDPEASQSAALRDMGCHVVEKPFAEQKLLGIIRTALDDANVPEPVAS